VNRSEILSRFVHRWANGLWTAYWPHPISFGEKRPDGQSAMRDLEEFLRRENVHPELLAEWCAEGSHI
jgi:hypothetical protein